MSQRGKRPNNGNSTDGPSPVKRRKGRPPITSSNNDADELASTSSNGNGGGGGGNVGVGALSGFHPSASSSTAWQARPHLDLKMSSIYNRSAPEAPAELFRKDLISAMKLPDSEPLSHEEYWIITDQWKQEWERGVQVPVNPDSLPEPSVRLMNENYYKARQDFKLPKNKFIRITKDENFSHDKHYLTNTPAIADSVCSYDLDQLDEAWLKEFNGERSMCGLPSVNEEQFERIFEELETRCHDKIQAIMKSEEGLGIEYDENVICDVCRSPDSEEANEMVFCDNCNICVHQACYGITTIPSGQWLCRTCSMGKKPDCVLCPNKGGAMKSTRSGQKWAHVSCALWIPEVSIGSVDRMEPITKISSIPQSRWALVCVLCRERVGACIQCSVKTCKTAYHVTCAFQHGLEMRAIIEDENAEDGVKLRSYCQKHSVKKEPKNNNNSANSEKAASASEDDDNTTIKTSTTTSLKTSSITNSSNNNNNNNSSTKKKIRKEMTSEERSHARRARLIEIQSEFAKHVSIKDISCHLLDVDQEGINSIYNYWILKRKAGGNEPLLPPKAGDVDVLSQTDQEQADMEKMKMFVHLRQDLERVRNLCYMVSRREKLSRSFFKMREQIFNKQMAILSSHKKASKILDDDTVALKAILESNHGPSIYDVLYSSDTVRDSQRIMPIEEMIDSLLGNKSSKSLHEINGNIKREKMDAISRYSKLFNGATTTTTTNKKYGSSYDSLTSDTDGGGVRRSRRRMTTSTSAASTSDEDEKPPRPISTTAITTPRTPSRKITAAHSPAKSIKSITSPLSNTAPSTPTTQQQQQPKKKGRPLGSTKQATAEKRRQMGILSSKEKLNKSLSMDSTTDDEHLPHSQNRTRNRHLAIDEHLTDESDELVPIKNSSGHSIPTTQGGTIKRMHSSAIYSDSSESSSTDKDNRTDHTVSDSQLQPFRTKAAMKEFNINELLPSYNTNNNSNTNINNNNNNKKSTVDEKKSSIIPNSNKKNSSTNQSKKQPPNLPPPSSTSATAVTTAIGKKTSPTKSSKSRRKSINNNNSTLTSDSEVEDVKKSSPNKKDSLVDFLVVPQREAAKKASENLMKTNSSSLIQSISSTATEKSKREAKEKLDETIAAAKAAVDSVEREKLKEVKMKQKTSKEKEKEKSSSLSKKKDEKEIVKKVEEISDFLPYVPQRQAAKKAAEHIKGINSSTVQQQQVTPTPTPNTEEKSTKLSSVGSKKSLPDRRKSTAVDLSSTSTSTSSSSASDSSSDSDSETASPKQLKVSKTPSKAPTASTRRTSIAAGTKQKAKDLLFLDKTAKSIAKSAKSSSSESSNESEGDESSSERVHSSRLPEKGSKRKKSIDSKKKSSITQSSVAKKETPTRRMSIANATKATTSTISSSNRSPQKSSNESTEVISNTSTRKRSTSTASPLFASPSSSPTKVSTNNKSRSSTDTNKRDLAKLSDKRKSSSDVIPEPIELKVVDKVVEEKSEISPPKETVVKPPSPPPVVEKEKSPIKEIPKVEEIKKNVDNIVSVKMDIDETISTPKVNLPSHTSPMISIPNVNLNATNVNLFDKVLNSEDTERETYNLIEKLRQKNKKNVTPVDNNNVVLATEKTSIMQSQNENTPEQSQQMQQIKPIDTSPAATVPPVLNDNKSASWQQQQDNLNYQRNILKSSSCNKMNVSLDSPQAPSIPLAPASCMVIEQQQKQQQLAASQQHQQKGGLGSNMEVENNMRTLASFIPTMSMLMNEQNHHHHHHMEQQIFNMQMQQQQHKSMNLLPQQHQQSGNLLNRSDVPTGMENMMNSMNQQAMKNFPPQQQQQQNQQLSHLQQKSPMSNDYTNALHMSQNPISNFNAYNFPDTITPQFPGPVSLLPSDLNVQVPFPSPGQAMFPPNFNTNVNASFTQQQQQSSSQNNNNNKVNSNEMQSYRNIHAKSTPQQSPFNQLSDLPETALNKSPAKSTRSSPRNMTPTYVSGGGKTPQKSPSKSPRQPTTPASNESSLSRQNSQKGKMTPNSAINEGKQRKSRTNSQASPATTPAEHRANKGRPRNNNKNTKGRFAVNQMPFMPFNNETEYLNIDKKLVGTVYDFSADEEFATNPSVENLRAMRDRRKSIDFHSKMNRDGSSQSPKFAKTSSLKSTTPLTHPLALNNHTMPNTVVNEPESLNVASSISLVNMPGPVDMRTYNSFDNTNDSYNSQLLGAFATNTVDQTLDDINEEQEKELQTALKASNDKQKTPTSISISTSITTIETKSISGEVTNIVEESVDSEASFAKVSFSDSRNQLKLKIKGPLAHHHQQDIQSQSISHNAQIIPQASSANSAATSSNRRQMRKKELLQQYWNQGQNVDQEQSNIVPNDQQTATNVSLNRVGGIPKAVDSMRLELLNYESFQDLNFAEYKKRKRFAYRAGTEADIDMTNSANNDAQNISNDMDTISMDSNNKKRRNQRGRTQVQHSSPTGIAPPPKLKIKIGADVMETTGSDLPPKKRLIAQPPSYQDLKRESMNFRKQMMDSFSEEKKTKEVRTKADKEKRKEKKKRKKEKKRQSVEIVSQPATSEGGFAPLKLTLKISSKPPSLNTSVVSESESSSTTVTTATSTAPPPLKLKLSRNSQGNGEYNILNSSQKNKQEKDKSLSPPSPTPPPGTINNNNPVSSAEKTQQLTKKLEVALERIDDIEKAKSELTNKSNNVEQQQLKQQKEEVASKNCQVR